jgi:hypothetical protein
MGASQSTKPVSVTGGDTSLRGLTVQEFLDDIQTAAADKRVWKALSVADYALVSKMLHIPASLPLPAVIKAAQSTIAALVQYVESQKIDTRTKLLSLAPNDARLRALLLGRRVHGGAVEEDQAGDDTCVICLERFADSDQPRATQLDTCTGGCNRKLHEACARTYIESQCANRTTFTCPWCRSRTYPCPGGGSAHEENMERALARAEGFMTSYPAFYRVFLAANAPYRSMRLIDDADLRAIFVTALFVLFWIVQFVTGQNRRAARE